MFRVSRDSKLDINNLCCNAKFEQRWYKSLTLKT